MSYMTTDKNVAHPFCPVKPPIINCPVDGKPCDRIIKACCSCPRYIKSSLSSNSMIHHNVLQGRNKIIVSYGSIYKGTPYGVSRTYRVLSPQLLLKKYDLIRDCLAFTLGLTVAQREVTLRLLRLWAYYGSVYPKESQITELPGCSKATFWRTIHLLEESHLLQVINRYVIRPHAQISNLYRLDKLILVIARYLAEHGIPFLEKWLTPVLTMPAQSFYRWVYQSPGARAGPLSLALVGP